MMAAQEQGRTIKPSRFRKQHSLIERANTQIQDSAGNPGAPFRLVTALDFMERNGTISKQDRSGADRFRDDFTVANFATVRAVNYERSSPGQGDFTVRQMDARRRVSRAMDALGGHGSPGGCCAWFVLGEGLSLKDWAQREGWKGKALKPHTAAGILLGVLGTLASHYGLT